ncbi:MAG: transcription antitermination factor NusB [Deltaproteobacteria bacterium]|nr:MAG: transcription antitermination factor NusB [Deltaproteobacteria bacterium]
MKNPRSKSRELALQALFYMDMRHEVSAKLLDMYCENFIFSQEEEDQILFFGEKASEFSTELVVPFFTKLVRGLIPVISEIDTIIERFSSNWKISRMGCVDRNAIRIAVYEFMFCEDIPPKVSINEAINIGKKFGTPESGAFVNGILDSIRIALKEKKIHMLPSQKKT